ncbi:hypothetical protein [Actinophytocola oryzae]|uniref:DUF308 domain-containing protein n=1 Tax=Actinophytocola oryzae TaxID=502181 RepID=A0A4R7UVB7_9PSEU|nr:hypothetical protein [Actinophytocola oryzae]TDV40400.1 hypothetical protein CLV71_123110 [Actinophytocola oryzae]
MSDRPDDVDAAFAEIVADLRREGVGRTIPDLDDLTDTSELPVTDDPDGTPPAGFGSLDPSGPSSLGRTGTAPAPPPGGPSRADAWRGHDAEWDWSWGTDEDHYVPPDPPPLPKLRPLTVVALVLIVLGVILLIIPTLVGLDARIATPIALLSVTCGGGMLLLRIRQNPKDPNARDDGAQI